MTALSFTLSQSFSTFHNISVFRYDVAEFSDNLAGIPMSYTYHNHLITNALRLFNVIKSSAKLSDI